VSDQVVCQICGSTTNVKHIEFPDDTADLCQRCLQRMRIGPHITPPSKN
jgi:hypothetical protein